MMRIRTAGSDAVQRARREQAGVVIVVAQRTFTRPPITIRHETSRLAVLAVKIVLSLRNYLPLFTVLFSTKWPLICGFVT